MSAEVVVKKRGRPKKIVNAAEEVLEAPEKSSMKRTTARAKPAAKKVTVITEKPVKVEAAKSRLPPKKSNSSVLEEIQKLEALKERTNPTVSTKLTASTHSSPKPITTPVKPSSKPITPPSSGTPPKYSATSSPVTNAFNSKILKEVEALSKKASPTNETSGSTTKTTKEIPSESKTKPITAKVGTISKDPLPANKVSGSTTKPVEKPAIESTTKPTTTVGAQSPRNLHVPAASTVSNASSSKILKEIEAVSKQAILADETTKTKQQTFEKPVPESIPKPISANTKVINTQIPLKDAGIGTVANPTAAEFAMAKTEAKPKPYRQNLPPSPVPQNAQPKPKIPITQLNSKIVSDLSARGGARPIPGKLPAEYKPLARTYTRFIVALPIFLVTSYVLYERLAVREDQRLISFPSIGPKKGEPSPISKDGPTK